VSILWATTFSKDLYEESGKLLIESFLRTETPGKLVVYVEGMDLNVNILKYAPNIEQRRIDHDPVLADFMEKHRSVIPQSLGGDARAPECRCRGGPLDVHHKKHKLPCVGYWFCKNAFRWLRKPLAAKRAADEFSQKHDILMWVDADASFLQTVPEAVVESWFAKKYACIYLKNKRSAIETGVFGYNLPLGGHAIADAVLARYTTGVFRKDPRWDDCVQMEKGIAAAKKPAIDLATDLGPRNTVIQFSPLAPYLGHDKGRHNRTKKLT
jgi:hypothetical protein